jgi:hypothetical protein
MLPTDHLSLESAARSVRDRLGAERARRFTPPPSWPRGRGPAPNKRRDN